MGYFSVLSTIFVLLFLLMVSIYGKPRVPALFFFGDSTLDVGNNNYLPTLVKANYPTGRFSNGKLISDFSCEFLDFTSYQPAYLSLDIKGKNILNGANFASADSGYHDSTAKLYRSMSLSQQLEHYKEYKKDLMKIAGRTDALSIINGALHIVGFGSGDILLNYYLNPLLRLVYTPNQFNDILVQNYADFIQNLYAQGARKIVVKTLTAIGCLPATITVFNSAYNNKCVVELNNVALSCNQKLNSTSVNLRKMLPGLNLVLLNGYQPLYNLVTKPLEYGFSEARKSCFGTSFLEKTSTSFNNKKTIIRLCPNTSQYVFWDGLHLTETANKFVAAAELFSNAISLII
ncbi:GDSL esterase/lipase At5g22810-like [Vicia villosa]|uniref:GDSL esterase/lipase At5g22810-like n=1 Tax=Vicia villosa TaxID=3911 RepID=UPI00273AF909|nr:GDSL esterase/lipase At5g22810-like [Vicia villosa]